jgi:predicted DsbA family dithiol-disulfide isomerase
VTASTTEVPGTAAPSRNPVPVIEIACFTDPLCCWSWGLEPQLRRLRYGFAGQIAFRLRMGGMIGDWDRFSDPLNDVHRAAQMGPLWVQAGAITGMPVEAAIWVHDAPASSWPSCLAVKAASLQSAAAADLYLRRVREAVMIEGRNISRDDVLIDVALRLAEACPGLLDADRFESDLGGRDARAALEEDVREARFRGVGRFPCLGLRRPGAAPAWMIGWRPWEALLAAVRAFAPDLGEERRPESPESYARYWTGVTEREILVALGGTAEATPDACVGPLSSGTHG